MWSTLANWISTAPVLGVAAVVLMLMAGAATLGAGLKRSHEKHRAATGETGGEGQEAYIVSAVLGLLALLMGFTFSLAVDRYETRRALVLEEANAIGTAWLRAQLLEAPHRDRIGSILVQYADNRLALSQATTFEVGEPLLEANDRMVVDLWAATDAAFPTIQGLDFSSTFLDSINHVIDLDAARKAARTVRVPPAVFLVLILYMAVSAGVMGYVLVGPRSRVSGLFLLTLMTLALALVIDIDRPVRGGVQENEGPMQDLVAFLHETRPATFDRWRPTP